MDGIGGARAKDHIARIHDGPHQVPQSFFYPDRNDRLGLRIDIDLETSLVPARDGDPELVDSSRDRVAMVMRFLHRFDELCHNMRRGRSEEHTSELQSQSNL